VAYSLEYTEDAARELARRSRRLQRVIVQAVLGLAIDPEPAASAPLYDDWEGHRRLRVQGTLRVLYRVNHRRRTIEIVKIGGRGSIYD
jgi:mRNA-degrading endonuclease RelE of RelBE toxin-antitoxin system